MTWVRRRVEHLAAEVRTTVDPQRLGDVEVDHYSIPALDATGGPEIQAANEIQSQKQVLSGGEVLVSRLNPRKARVLTVPQVGARPAMCSGEFVVLRPTQVVPRYLEYLLLSESARQELDGAVQSVTRSHQRIRPEQLLKMTVSVAAEPEAQRAIADFLDTETARIDALIAKKRRMIDLLDERVDSVILEMIGNSGLARRDGEATAPIRRLLHKHVRWVSEGEMITAFRDGQVTSRSARGREGFTNAWTEGARVQRVDVGDVVVHGLDGFSGAIGDAQQAGVCSPAYHVCTPLIGDGAFYGRLLRLLALDGYLGNFAVSTRERAVDFRNWDLFGRIPVPVVPIDVQMEIGDRIRGIRPLRDRIRQSETLALEHRQALITAAVTGELPVPEVAA